MRANNPRSQRPRPWRRAGLRGKIVACFFLPTALILGLAALLAFRAYQDVTRELVLQRNRELVRLLAARVSSELQQEFIDPLEVKASRLGRMPPASWQDALQAFPPVEIFEAGLVALRLSDAAVLASLPPNLFESGQHLRQTALYGQLSSVRTQQPVLSDIFQLDPDGPRLIAFCVPILAESGERQGYLVGLLRAQAKAPSVFRNTVERLVAGPQREALLVDGNRRQWASALCIAASANR